MNQQNKITQIILECAPSDMTIAQIKLMTAKLMTLVDNESETCGCECWRKNITQDTPVKRRYMKTQGDLLPEYLDDNEPSPTTVIDGIYARIREDGLWVVSGYKETDKGISDELLGELIAKFCQRVGIETIISDDNVWVWRNGKRDKIVWNYNGEKYTLGEPHIAGDYEACKKAFGAKDVSC